MKLINDKLISEIAEYLPEDSHKLFLKQIDKIQFIIEENQDLYKTDLGYRTAMDSIIREILSGSFLDIKEPN